TVDRYTALLLGYYLAGAPLRGVGRHSRRLADAEDANRHPGRAYREPRLLGHVATLARTGPSGYPLFPRHPRNHPGQPRQDAAGARMFEAVSDVVKLKRREQRRKDRAGRWRRRRTAA